jgi:uncharacterized membrane protein
LGIAIAGAFGVTGAGAVAGAITGYLKDQGFEEHHAKHYEDVVSGGGAVLSVSVPSGNVDIAKAKWIIDKYSGTCSLV